VIFGMKRD